MFTKRKVSETRFVTRDETGRVELWQNKPTFINVGNGEGFFVDVDEPDNQIDLDAPINRKIAGKFILQNGTCLEVHIFVSSNNTYLLPGATYFYTTTLVESFC